MPEAPLPEPATPAFPSPSLDCHRIDLDAPMPDTALRWLSAEEEARALRFRFQHLRHRYRASRVALRCLLAERLSIAPAHVRFITAAQGKPALHPEHASTLQFNLSHSEGSGWVVLAAQGVGIDVEHRHRPMPEREALLSRIATPAELAFLDRLPGRWQGPAFFLLWTRKEAMLKAWGDGIRGFGSLRRLETKLAEISGTESFLDAGTTPGEPLPVTSATGSRSASTSRLTAPDTAATEAAIAAAAASIPALSDAPGQIVPTATLPLMRISHPAHRPDADSNRQPLWLTSFAVGDEIISVAAPSMFSVRLHPWAPPPCPPDGSPPEPAARQSPTEMP